MLLVLLIAFGMSDPACVSSWGEARYRNYGYDHLVHVQNGCDKPVTCDVSTDVTPKVHAIRVKPGKKVTVLTRKGSPARKFTPKVRCTLSKTNP